jgi:pimeloyl-ACP methyl ester carboxylesterase
MLPATAHGVHLEEPELFNKVIEKFPLRHV